ncbi:MAG: tetratricopeptide repeat protein [Bacteroidetes bacterium]|nr:tetratricopeptide repeat protein [Bacteroidota bacterium]
MILERIELLISQRRYDMAEKEIMQALSESPQNALLHAYLAICLMGRDQLSEAKDAVKKAISFEPDFPFVYGLLSKIHYQEGDMKASMKIIDEAIRLNPVNADFHIHKAYIHFYNQEWQACLEAAERGLGFDSENVDGLNIRARVLVKLGRSPEASSAFEASMNRNPENAYTHINKGWALLEEGNYDEALKHFKEAVRLDPNNDTARAGLVEGLKAKYWIYRGYLKFAFWLSNMSSKNRWFLMIGLILIVNFVPFLVPFYLVLIFFSWFSSVFFNLLLRFSTYGKYALSKEQMNNSNLFGSLLLGGIGCLIAAPLSGIPQLETIGFVALGMLFPVTGTFHKQNPASKKKSLYVTYGLLALGLATIVTSFVNPELGGGLLTIYAIGIMGYTFFVNMIP